MDLLESLNVDDLPEQQTRTSHLLQDHPDFDLKLGFDSCCCCGKKNPKLECPSCRRVKYCSKECCEKDASLVFDNDDEQALGHTSVICSLLNLCNDDEIVEGQDPTEMSTLDDDRKSAATDRSVSELESYPATLANVIMDGPPYQDTLQRCKGEGLTIHVIGASPDSELWKGHPDVKQEKKVWEGYADALAEIAEKYKLPWIRLHFFGPELPKTTIDKTVPIPAVQASKSAAKLLVRSFNTDYQVKDDKDENLPDTAVFFNPGFTCTDYDWEPSLSYFQSHQVPFLVATNTEMECMADIQYLMDRQIFQDIPAGLKSMLVGGGDAEEAEEGGETGEDVGSVSFFSLNPYAGLRVRQSGTMANDLYVKSRWIFGGITAVKPSEPKKRTAGTADASNKKKRRTHGSGNSKTSNPALI
jgi:hypothetical protein